MQAVADQVFYQEQLVLEVLVAEEMVELMVVQVEMDLQTLVAEVVEMVD
jgi:hypothetical protein